eukprot:scaffold516994_cov19-Prasinocladus_malaysianus.AAC.1
MPKGAIQSVCIIRRVISVMNVEMARGGKLERLVVITISTITLITVLKWPTCHTLYKSEYRQL